MLGTNEEFAEFCQAAREEGIHIILDGVFSHTGADSIYFNRFGNYPASAPTSRRSRRTMNGTASSIIPTTMNRGGAYRICRT